MVSSISFSSLPKCPNQTPETVVLGSYVANQIVTAVNATSSGLFPRHIKGCLHHRGRKEEEETTRLLQICGLQFWADPEEEKATTNDATVLAFGSRWVMTRLSSVLDRSGQEDEFNGVGRSFFVRTGCHSF